jgi:hypothetical protein
MFSHLSHAYDPQDIAVLDRALVHAWQTLVERADSRTNGSQASALRAALARAIIVSAESGERDEQRLAVAALAAVK